MNPEVGFEETRTSSRLREILVDTGKVPMGNVKAAAITGLFVDIHGEGPEAPEAKVKCVAIRTDLDGLSMTEKNNNMPYRSKNEGVAHMCGHDGHMAALTATALLLQKRVARIPKNCTVRLLLQPAEESTEVGKGGFDFNKTGGGGAMPMIWDGCLEGVDEVYGWHNWPAWPLGEMRVAVGPVMANVHSFVIKIDGRGGHGSQPHVCVDPIVCGCHVVTSLQTIVSRSVPSFNNAVVSVTMFHAGERKNVIPDSAELQGTIRTVDELSSKIVLRRLKEIVTNICKGFNCESDVEILTQYPCVNNPAEGVDTVTRCAAKLTGDVSLKVSSEQLPMLGGEDFSYYLQQRPGCFFFLGTQELLTRGLAAYDGAEDQPRSNCACHGTAYDFNDNVLPRAVSMFIRIIEDRFGIDLYTQEEILGAP